MKAAQAYIFFICVALFKSAILEDGGHCVMYGTQDVGGKSHGFFYNGSAKPLDRDSAEIFKSLCSFMLPSDYNDGDEIYTCCNSDQLKSFSDKSSIVPMLAGRCSPCLQNFYMFTCSMICDPHQSNFVVPYINTSDDSIVDGIDYALSYDFVKGFFDSCKDVKIPNSIIPFTSFICESKLGTCTPQFLIDGIAEKSPLPIYAKMYEPEDKLPSNITELMNFKALLCNESYSSKVINISACSCMDCTASCPNPPSIPDSRVFLIFNYFTIWQFVVVILFALFCLTVVSLVSFNLIRTRRSVTYEPINVEDVSESMNGDSLNPSETDSQLFGDSDRIRKSALAAGPLMRWANLVTHYPVYVIVASFILIIVLSFGMYYRLEVTSDPIDLWSIPKGKLRLQKEYLDKTFGPFYRIEQFVISVPNGVVNVIDNGNFNITLGPSVTQEAILVLFNIQEDIFNLKAPYSYIDHDGKTYSQDVSFKDVCLKPLYPSSDECAFFSVTQYFQNNVENFNQKCDYNWDYHLGYCSKNTGSIDDTKFCELSCLSTLMSPVQPQLVFGGYENDSFTNSSALVVTLIVENKLDQADLDKIYAWESEFISYMKNFSHPNISVTYSSESSIHKELDRQTHTDVFTVAMSYFCMFVYVSISLGRISFGSWKLCLVGNRLFLALTGVLLVICSVLSTVGFFCYLGFPITLIVLEVLPFLVLAVGVDNIFILVQEYQHVSSLSSSQDNLYEDISVSLGNVGGGMIVSVISQVITFGASAISDIPAIRSFSLFASFALGLNFILQMTCFLAVFALDVMRQKANRIACVPCVKVEVEGSYNLSVIKRIMKSLSFIVKNKIAGLIIIIIFISGWLASLYVVPSLPVSLDQTLPLPSDSYLLPYFDQVFRDLRSGPPVYFIVEPGFEYENSLESKKLCSSASCWNNSLSYQVLYSSLISNYSKIATPLDSWVDTYYNWLKPSDKSSCCRYRVNPNNKEKEFCPSTFHDVNKTCVNCISEMSDNWTPTSDDFSEYLPWFLNDPPTVNCPNGGLAGYKSNVILNPKFYSSNRTKDDIPVKTSRFMAYHTALSHFDDFKDALVRTLKLSDHISADISHSVFPYSVFYIFFESYLTIWKRAYTLFGIALGVILTINLILFKCDLRLTLITTLTIFAMDLMNAGFMFILGINLNPVSLVNLIMLIGINVEFVSHIVRSFKDFADQDSVTAAQNAMVNTGSSVLSGISLTKIIGISVLGFSKSKLFRIYYFKMYSIAIFVGTIHGLLFMPVVLRFIGSGNKPEHPNPVIQSL